MYTYKLAASEKATTWGNGNVSCRLEITNTDTGETKVCDDFTYLDDDEQETLEYIFGVVNLFFAKINLKKCKIMLDI